MDQEQKVRYRSEDGLHLSGVFNRPPSTKHFALMAHGITMDKNEWNNLHFKIANDLSNQAIGSFRFDYRAHGESEGEMRDMTVVGEYLDVKSSVKQIKQVWKKKIAIVASSFGAGSSILYAALHPANISCLVLLNPVIDYNATFLNPTVDWAKESFNRLGFKHLEEKGFLLLDGKYELGAKLIAEFELVKPYEFLKSLKCPVLTIHGDKDSMVPYKVSKKYGAPNKRSKFITIKNAEHGFVDWDDEEGVTLLSSQNQAQVTKLIIEWISKNA